MAANGVSKLVRLGLAALITGCAHEPVDTGASTPPSATAETTPSVIDPGIPADITALAERLTGYRLTLFSVSQGKYTFYVGGVLNASFETATQILRISALTPEDTAAVTCEYTPQGVLFLDPKMPDTDKDAFVKECNGLARRLNAYLSR